MSDEIIENMLITPRLTVYALRNRHLGNRPRVLYLGGSNFDLRLKRSFLETALIEEFDFATYEPRGIGRTEHPIGDWSMADFAADALSVLDALDWPDAHVVGESFGGMTALHLASFAPRRVASLVIVSATAGGPEHRSYDISEFLSLSRKEAAAASLRLQDIRNVALAENDPAAFDEKLKDRLEFEAKFANPSIVSGGYARLLEARRRHDCTATVSQLQIPALVVAGQHDRQAAPDAQHALAQALPYAVFQEHDAGHGVLFAVPGAMQSVARFLKEEHQKMICSFS